MVRAYFGAKKMRSTGRPDTHCNVLAKGSERGSPYFAVYKLSIVVSNVNG